MEKSPVHVKVDDSKAIVVVEKTIEHPEAEKPPRGSSERDIALANVEAEKRSSLIKAWEENEKSKSQNKSLKKISGIVSWENAKKADLEAKLKKIEESLEKKKANYTEKMKNKVAVIHRQAEEKKAHVEATKSQEILKAEETAAKFRATRTVPKKGLGCFG